MATSQATTQGERKGRGRPASFDRDELLLRVMQLFWDRGYAALSLNEIAQATGLTRASLYNAFGGKEQLFLEAMRTYAAQSPDAVLADIRPGDPVGPVLFSMFDQASQQRAADPAHRGCMAINCISELGSQEDRVGRAMARMYEDWRGLLRKLVRQAVRQRELPASADVETTADLLLTVISGFSVFTKTGASERQLRTMTFQFLRQLGFAAP